MSNAKLGVALCTWRDLDGCPRQCDAIRLPEGLEIIIEKLKGLLRRLGEQIIETVDHTTMAFTHLQPAEPTTVGYRLANMQDCFGTCRNLRLAVLYSAEKDLRPLGPVLRISSSLVENLSRWHTFNEGSWTDLGLKRPWLRRKQHPESKNIKSCQH